MELIHVSWCYRWYRRCLDRKCRAGWVLRVLFVIGGGIRINELCVLGTRQIAIGDPAGKLPPLLDITGPDIDNAIEAAGGHPPAVCAGGGTIHPP